MSTDYVVANGFVSTEAEQSIYPNAAEDEIEYCKEWINEFITPRNTINEQRSSYGLKHRVEQWPGRESKYVSNGAFILAALELGYTYKRIQNGPNAFFNMSFVKLNKIMKLEWWE